MQRSKVLSYLGLATKAGRVSSGEFSVEKSVRQHRAKLVIVSEDEDTWDIRFSRELTVWADRTCSDRMLSFMTMS